MRIPYIPIHFVLLCGISETFPSRIWKVDYNYSLENACTYIFMYKYNKIFSANKEILILLVWFVLRRECIKVDLLQTWSLLTLFILLLQISNKISITKLNRKKNALPQDILPARWLNITICWTLCNTTQRVIWRLIIWLWNTIQ